MTEWKGEKSALLEMRKHFSWYTLGRRGAARVRTEINRALSFREVEALLRSLEEETDGKTRGEMPEIDEKALDKQPDPC